MELTSFKNTQYNTLQIQYSFSQKTTSKLALGLRANISTVKILQNIMRNNVKPISLF